MIIKGWQMPYVHLRRLMTKMFGFYISHMGLTIELIWWAFEIWTPYRVTWERNVDEKWKNLDKLAADLDAQKLQH